MLKVLVIGAGVAGTSCALRLRRHGIDVDLVEKMRFPRAKVCGCCLGGAGLELLAQLSLRSWVESHGAHTSRWIGSIGGRPIELPLPQGIAISRETLDTELLRRAGVEGARIVTPAVARVHQLNPDSVTVRLQLATGETQHHDYSVVVVASGLNADGSQRLLPWREKPNGPFGAAFFAESDRLAPGTIHMACDDDGYVGLVRLEDNRIDIAAALAPGSTSAIGGDARQRINAILMRSRLQDWDYHNPSPIMTTPPLRRLRQAGRGRVIAIGDAAGYVEPFTGEGMTWGMMSGIAAADLITQSAADLSPLGETWNSQISSLLRSKRIACRAVTSALRSSLARRAIAATLSQWPGIAAPLIQHLNRI